MFAFSLVASLLISAVVPACGGNRAYLDWRPGLTELDFDGVYEISLDELDGFAAEAAANTSFDRFRGEARADASERMAALGEAVAGNSNPDPRGYSILALGGDGSVSLAGDRGRTYTGVVDWFAITPDGRHAALVSGTKLAVAIDGASTGIELGSLIGSGLAGHRALMLVRGDELTVFTLPELGGVVSANEPGYVFSFRHQPGAREAWQISVARVVVKI